MQTSTMPYTGAQINNAIDRVLNDRSVSLDDFIILIADFSDVDNYTVESGGCNSANGTMIAI